MHDMHYHTSGFPGLVVSNSSCFFQSLRHETLKHPDFDTHLFLFLTCFVFPPICGVTLTMAGKSPSFTTDLPPLPEHVETATNSKVNQESVLLMRYLSCYRQHYPHLARQHFLCPFSLVHLRLALKPFVLLILSLWNSQLPSLLAENFAAILNDVVSGWCTTFWLPAIPRVSTHCSTIASGISNMWIRCL